MNQYLAPEVTQPTQSRKKIIIYSIVAALILVAGALAMQTYFAYIHKPVALVSEQVTEDDVLSKGLLYYSASRVGEDESNLFELNLNTKQATLLPKTEGLYHISNTKKDIDAASFANKDGKSVIELVKADAIGVRETSYIESSVLGGHIQRLTWNDDQAVLLYEVVASTSVSIYAYNVAEKSSTFLTQGQSPLFYDADTFLFLQTNGLYAFELNGRSEDAKSYLVKAFSKTGTTLNTSMIFSPDKKTLLVTHPDKGIVDLHTVGLMEDGRVTSLTTGKISQSMISPVSSPDGRFIAFFELGTTIIPGEMILSTIDLQKGVKVSETAVEIDNTQPFVISFWK
jgi:hypothetical protein